MEARLDVRKRGLESKKMSRDKKTDRKNFSSDGAHYCVSMSCGGLNRVVTIHYFCKPDGAAHSCETSEMLWKNSHVLKKVSHVFRKKSNVFGKMSNVFSAMSEVGIL